MADVTGDKKLIAQLNQKRNALLKNLRVGVYKGGLFLLKKSLEIVPRDEGYLARSARCRISEESTKERPVVKVSYGTDYAVYVHEIPDPPTAHGWHYNLKHRWEIATGAIEPWSGRPYHERGPNQQYKFLEKPARENRPEIRDIIANEVKKSA